MITSVDTEVEEVVSIHYNVSDFFRISINKYNQQHMF